MAITVTANIWRYERLTLFVNRLPMAYMSHPGRLSRPQTVSIVHGSGSHARIDQQLED